MYELVQVGEKTFYIACPSKVGIYKITESTICLVDSGLDKDAAKKIYKVIQEHNWNISFIINTHSHADHIGGNAFFQEKTHCPIYCVGADKMFIEFPELEASYLFGGFPNKDLRNKFFYSAKSNVSELTQEMIPKGLKIIRLDGHSFSQIGIKTDDNVWFLADAITGERIIEKYHVIFLADVRKSFESLKKIKSLTGSLFIPSHGDVLKDVTNLAQINIDKMNEIIHLLLLICKEATSSETVIKLIFDHFGLSMSFAQNVLVGSTIKSYLSYLYDEGKLEVIFIDNILLWKTVS